MHRMKNFIYLPMFIYLFLVSCQDDDMIVGSGRIVTENRALGDFTKVRSEGVFEVTITQGPVQSVEISADDNIIGQVKTTVTNNELRLSLKNDGYNRVTLKAKITVPQLNSLNNSGTGSMAVNQISESGHFKVRNSGTGNIKINGNATSLSVYNEGTGRFKGFDFMVKDAEVETIGTGDVEVNCSDNLKVTIEGSSKVYYKGNPILDVHINGSGSTVNAN
jgi:hypothetical protein